MKTSLWKISMGKRAPAARIRWRANDRRFCGVSWSRGFHFCAAASAAAVGIRPPYLPAGNSTGPVSSMKAVFGATSPMSTGSRGGLHVQVPEAREIRMCRAVGAATCGATALDGALPCEVQPAAASSAIASHLMAAAVPPCGRRGGWRSSGPDVAAATRASLPG